MGDIMKRLFKKAESESIRSNTYDFKRLYERTEQHISNIEESMKESLSIIDKLNSDNVINSMQELESIIDKIYRDALDSYSKINVSKDLGMENDEQLKLSKEKIDELESKLKSLFEELKEMKSNHSNYSSEVEELKSEVTQAKDLLDRMEEHIKQNQTVNPVREASLNIKRQITAKRKDVIKNIHDGMMETCNEIMHASHKLEEIKEYMKSKIESSQGDLEPLKEGFKKALEDIYNDIKTGLEDIRDDMEIGLDVNYKTDEYIEEKGGMIEQLYSELEEITEHLRKLKDVNSELTDEYESLKSELSKLHKMMMV